MDCPRCEGNTYVECECTECGHCHTRQCPRCEGTGEVDALTPDDVEDAEAASLVDDDIPY